MGFWRNTDETTSLATESPSGAPLTNLPAHAATEHQRADPNETVAIGRAVRMLLLAFAVVRLLGAVGLPVDPIGSIAIGLAGLMILGHVVGTIVGTSRCKSTDTLHPFDLRTQASESALAAILARAESPSLHSHLPLERRLIYWIIGGAICCAAAMAVTTFGAWPKIGPLGIAILEMSAATIGAYIGFMASRLTGATRRAFRQATGDRAATFSIGE